MKQLPITVLQEFSSCGSIPVSLHMPRGFGRRVGSEMNTGHVFLEGVLTATALVRGRAGVERARDRARAVMISGHH